MVLATVPLLSLIWFLVHSKVTVGAWFVLVGRMTPRRQATAYSITATRIRLPRLQIPVDVKPRRVVGTRVSSSAGK